MHSSQKMNPWPFFCPFYPGDTATHLSDFFYFCVVQNLYFEYIWNNFLHTQVEQCITAILKNESTGSDHVLLSQVSLVDLWDFNLSSDSLAVASCYSDLGCGWNSAVLDKVCKLIDAWYCSDRLNLNGFWMYWMQFLLNVPNYNKLLLTEQLFSLSLSFYLSIYRSISLCMPVSISVCLSCLSVRLSVLHLLFPSVSLSKQWRWILWFLLRLSGKKLISLFAFEVIGFSAVGAQLLCECFMIAANQGMQAFGADSWRFRWKSLPGVSVAFLWKCCFESSS